MKNIKLPSNNLGLFFQNIAEKNKDSLALEFPSGEVITYRKLNKLVNQTARLLKKKFSIKVEDVVCISGVKRTETFCLMLACLKIGATYSVMDNSSPIERLSLIINTCEPKLIVAEGNLIDVLKKSFISNKFNFLENDFIINNEELLKYSEHNLSVVNSINVKNGAYIMFTSGSTGIPKGALITHANLLSFISWIKEEFGFNSTDKLTNVNPIFFDNSVFDFYSAFFSGSCLVPFSKDEVGNPSFLMKKINDLGCTSWFSVPSLLIYLATVKVLVPENMKKIRRIIFGGEGYPKVKLFELFKLYSSRISIYNVYGPTECTCICSNYEISSSDFEDLSGIPPLGALIQDFSYLILDQKLKSVQDNEVGELCLIGPSVGQGYYNDKKRTKESFIQNPYKQDNEIIYLTGDFVKYDSKDKNIYFVCRKDNQIKHMGYRIELDEIESALNRVNGIAESVVIHGFLYNMKQIIAFVAIEDSLSLSSIEIKAQLSEMIPNYMIPSKINVLNILPKNPSGKIDRNKLALEYL
jgi:D-alanine--poly(phosphoribitol) ligase subunit 1